MIYSLMDSFSDRFDVLKGKVKHKQLEEFLISVSHNLREFKNKSLMTFSKIGEGT